MKGDRPSLDVLQSVRGLDAMARRVEPGSRSYHFSSIVIGGLRRGGGIGGSFGGGSSSGGGSYGGGSSGSW